MTQTLPEAEKKLTYSGPLKLAQALAGGSLEKSKRLLRGNAVLQPGDGSNGATTEHTAIVLMNTTSSAATLTLSDADAQTGRLIVFADIGGNAATNNITITAETDASYNVNGSNQDITVSTNFTMKIIWSDGSNWFVFN